MISENKLLNALTFSLFYKQQFRKKMIKLAILIWTIFWQKKKTRMYDKFRISNPEIFGQIDSLET